MLPFSAGGAAGRNDPDGLNGGAPLGFLGDGVRDQKHRHPVHHAKGLPTLLPLLDPVLHHQMQRITENMGGNLKPDTVMFLLIERFLASSHVNRSNVIT